MKPRLPVPALALALAFLAVVPPAAWSNPVAPAPASPDTLKIDRTRSFIDVDVKATVGSFTGRLERYVATLALAPDGKVRTARLEFGFADLKTGDADRDARMLEWLGGGEPAGSYELGVLALAPDGQGQASGRLTFHGQNRRVEFPVLVTRTEEALTVTGETTIDTRQWGLPPLRHRFVVKVNPEVRIRFRLTAPLPPPPEE